MWLISCVQAAFWTVLPKKDICRLKQMRNQRSKHNIFFSMDVLLYFFFLQRSLNFSLRVCDAWWWLFCFLYICQISLCIILFPIFLMSCSFAHLIDLCRRIILSECISRFVLKSQSWQFKARHPSLVYFYLLVSIKRYSLNVLRFLFGENWKLSLADIFNRVHAQVLILLFAY